MSDQEGTSAINLGLASSLVSRFDLVLVLRDEYSNIWDTRVTDHIFYETGPVSKNKDIFDLTKLQAHFAAVRDFDPIVTDSASRILKAYYLACRADEERDPGRTTLRFNDSLYRLAKSHAKLLFRHEVTEIDAVLVVMLMESSFGFGRILQPKNVVTEDIPLGPSDNQIYELMDRLSLEDISPRNDNGIVDSGYASQFGLGSTADITENNNSRSQSERTNTQSTDPDVLLQNPDVRSQMIRRITKHSSPSKGKNVHGVDLSKFEFQKRVPNRLSTTSITNENVSTTIPPPSASRSNQDSSSSRGQQDQHRNSVVFQPLLQIQNMETMSPSHRKRNRMDFDDNELDRLFTLDDLIPSSTEQRNVTVGNNVPVAENISSSQPERKEEAERAKRLRIFNNCSDEDLDDFNLDF